MKGQDEQVSPDEHVYRRILQIYYNPLLPQPVAYVAFRPTDKDLDGISVCRPACGATVEEVAAGNHCVASLLVSEIEELNIDGLRPTIIPTPGTCRGHASIRELNVALRDGSKRQYRLLASKLAELASKEIVRRPD